MKRIAVLLLLLLPIIIFAQVEAPAKKWGISSNFNNFSLSGVNGGLGGKYWFDKNIAMSSSIQIYTLKEEQERASDYYNEYKRKIVNWENMVEYHFSLRDKISPYLGIGGSIGNIKYDRDVQNFDNNRYYTEIEDRYTFSIFTGIGVEYFINNRISLSGHYLLAYEYESNNFKRLENNIEDKDQKKSVNKKLFNIDTFGLAVTIYF